MVAGTLNLSQSEYVSQILSKYHIDQANATDTPKCSWQSDVSVDNA